MTTEKHVYKSMCHRTLVYHIGRARASSTHGDKGLEQLARNKKATPRKTEATRATIVSPERRENKINQRVEVKQLLTCAKCDLRNDSGERRRKTAVREEYPWDRGVARPRGQGEKIRARSQNGGMVQKRVGPGKRAETREKGSEQRGMRADRREEREERREKSAERSEKREERSDHQKAARDLQMRLFEQQQLTDNRVCWLLSRLESLHFKGGW